MNKLHQDQLRTEGWTVVPGCLKQDELKRARSLFWNWLEGLGSGIKQDDLETWSDENWPGDVYTGFIGTHGISQSEFAWYVRSRPLVKYAFAKIWQTGPNDLICSMDSILCWRPWELCDFEDWEVKTEGLHIDQNPNTKEGFRCVQGMVPLFDVTPETGGLQIVPGTHLDQQAFKSFCELNNGDWCPLPEKHAYIKERCLNKAQLVPARAGDLILWDSRLVHGGKIGTAGTNRTPQLTRLSVPICMMPRESADEWILSRRQAVFQQRTTMNHWANEANIYRLRDSHGKNISQEPKGYELKENEISLL